MVTSNISSTIQQQLTDMVIMAQKPINILMRSTISTSTTAVKMLAHTTTRINLTMVTTIMSNLKTNTMMKVRQTTGMMTQISITTASKMVRGRERRPKDPKLKSLPENQRKSPRGLLITINTTLSMKIHTTTSKDMRCHTTTDIHRKHQEASIGIIQ